MVGTSGRDTAVARTVGDLVKSGSTGDRADVSGRITRLAGPRTFWIGGGGAEALVLLAPSKPVAQMGIHAGEDVTISGLVRKGGDERAEGLQGEDASALRHAEIYIVAESVTKR